MHKLKFYLLITDTTTDESLNMDGNFEIFKSFLDGLNKSIREPCVYNSEPDEATKIQLDQKRSGAA
jgi:hypothetical protein